MINFVEDIFKWLVIGFFIAIIGTLIYNLLKFFVKQTIEQELQAQREELQRKNEDLKEQQKNIAQQNSIFYASVLKKQKEVEIAQQKATESLMNAEKIKENTEIKLQQLQRENRKLHCDLNAARQRAKRLAKKIDVSA